MLQYQLLNTCNSTNDDCNNDQVICIKNYKKSLTLVLLMTNLKDKVKNICQLISKMKRTHFSLTRFEKVCFSLNLVEFTLAHGIQTFLFGT